VVTLTTCPWANLQGESEGLFMGMIYKRGKTYWIKYYRNGKPYYESSRSRKETNAKRLLKRREGEISQGKLPGIYFDRVRFDELVDDLLTDYRVNQKKSLERVEMSLNHLKRYFQGFRVTQITTPKIQKYIEHRVNQKAANATINRELAALKRMLNLGAKQTPPKVDRAPYIPMLKENNTRKGFFEHQEYMALLTALPPSLRPMVTFGYKTGWRKSEILGLTWDRVDLKERTVRLEADETKNSEARTVYLDEELLRLLKIQRLRRNGCRFVFHRKGKRIKDFRGAWKKACEDVGLKGKLFHDLRRTGVRNMVRAGIQEQVAMMISGHKTRAVFDRYNIVSPDDLKQAARKMGKYDEMVTKTVTIEGIGRKGQTNGTAQVVEINR
jgi:integrase